jgi:glycosyltransferase involved in cell wall biosynthesis
LVRPIRVIHIVDKLSMDGANPSSCAFLLQNWIQCLDKSEFEVSVCTLRKPDPAGQTLEGNGIRVIYLGGGKYSSKNIGRIAELLHQERADIAHLHGYRATNFGRIASRKVRIMNIVHEHAALGLLPHQYLADLILRNCTDAAIAVSESVKKFMIRVRHIPPSKIRVIWNGIILADYKKRDKATCYKKKFELGIPEGAPVIGTVTRLREEKGIEYFIRAIPAILKEFPAAMFLIVGDGPLKKSLEDMARDLGVAQQIKFLGFRIDVPELLSILDVNVIPSLKEGFPLSFVEAMSVGNAIVASEVGGMLEIAHDSRSVLFVRPADSQEIAARVLFLLKNPTIANGMSGEAMRLSETFSVEKNASKIGELYVNLVTHQVKSRYALDQVST